MKNKKARKISRAELEAAYKLNFQLRFWALCFAYFCDFMVKIYLIYMVGGMPLAFVGASIDLIAKFFHLKSTKFRKDALLKIPQLRK